MYPRLIDGRPDIFDEYARRQYQAKAPFRNPFGEDEEPRHFQAMDVYTRIRILQQLSVWTLGNANRIREMMPPDADDLSWRMEPIGWDREDSEYYVLDDNRLYKRTDEPPPPPSPKPRAKSKAKAKSKKNTRSKATRSSKRRKVEVEEDEEVEGEEDEAGVEAGAQEDTVMTNGDHEALRASQQDHGYGFTDRTWSLVAITLDEYDEFLSTIFRSRDPNEKQLHKRVTDDVRPIIEKRAEALRAKEVKKLRELENLQKMATAKRSSRLADKYEKEKEERERREAEGRRERELRMAHEEEERQKRIEEGHESRRMTREQRLKEREVKRILHEEGLKRIQEAEERAASGSLEPETAEAERKRASARQTQAQKEQHKKELEQLEAENEDGKWYFDCSVCGMHGENMDDGTHSVACDLCGVWQHSKCHGYTPKQAEKDAFSFICKSCKRKEAEKNKPKIPPLKLGKKSSASPASPQKVIKQSPTNGSAMPAHLQRQLDGVHIPPQDPRQAPSPGAFGRLTNGPSLSPQGQAPGPPGYRYPPVGNFAMQVQHPPQQPWQGTVFPPPARRTSSAYAASPPPQHNMPNGYATSPHQQQHQQVHDQAVQAAGGHLSYVPQHHQAPHEYSPHTTPGQHRPPSQQGYPYQQQPPPMYYQPQHPRPGSAHQQQQPYHQYQQRQQQHQPPPQPLMVGFASPVKGTAPASHSPAPPPSSYGTHQPPPQSSPTLQRSPRTTFPPPPQSHRQFQTAGHSPLKSSPPPQPSHLPPPPSSSQQGPAARQPPQLLATPQHHQRPSAATPGSVSNGIAADGMSGPWPAGSQSIPVKKSEVPASSPMMPPSSASRSVVPPPGAEMAPQRAEPEAMGQSVIPVKKDRSTEVNGSEAASSPSHAPRQAEQQAQTDSWKPTAVPQGP